MVVEMVLSFTALAQGWLWVSLYYTTREQPFAL